MLKESVTVDDAIALLNEMLLCDIAATAALLANRVPCNQALADHDTIQVNAQHGAFFVGMLGVINGLFGVSNNGSGAIAYVFDNDGLGGRQLVRFERATQ